MNTTKQSQEKAILSYLQDGKSLTQLEALPLFGSFRLSARIYRLINQKGQPIKSEMVKRNGKWVAQYSYFKN